MKLIIDIPEKEFGIDINDKFKDFFSRLKVEIKEHLITNTSLVCGIYELETIDMLLKAFNDSTPLPKGHGRLKDENEMYAKGLKDAWECARKIVCPSDCYEGGLAGHVKEIFGYEGYLSRGIFKDFSASEAVDKIKEYEEKQKQTNDEIKVGDEVTYGYDTGICTKIDHKNNCFYVMWHDGSVGNWYININKFKKTGRHFPQIAEVLEQMRGEKG